MQVLIIGNGGREHAITWAIAKSPRVSQIWVAPGNPGTLSEPKTQNINIAVGDVDQLLEFAKRMRIDLTIVGPEAALANGIVDQFTAAGLTIFGPTQAAAQLETSKDFSKQFMSSHQIPTATYQTFTDAQQAHAYLETQDLPIVVKADGLAAGKGVIIAHDLATAKQAVTDMLCDNAFGKAGHRVVIEAFLEGTEISYIVMVDGQHILPLASSKDHKRLENADKGPNTGGMGAVSPSPLLTPELEQTILSSIIQPVVDGMQANGTPYRGFLYAGLMIDENHNPRVLEFNCRLGDPETQAILPRLKSDLATLCLAGAQGQLNQHQAVWHDLHAITVVMVTGGYPTKYHVGDVIKGLNRLPENVKIFQAGTKQHGQDLLTAGGRVISVTALGNSLQLAYDKVYNAAQRISWNNCFYRTDIGLLCMTPSTSA